MVPDQASYHHGHLEISPAGEIWRWYTTFLELSQPETEEWKYLFTNRISVEKSADSLMVVPLYAIYCFSLATFNI